ncbi:murein biosynthesis integral membrane protein MurJ [Brachyspira innocens]|uniref:Probable lipid II flippase MurJ n=1 Tax=Brachyspira innocens TaxID=13264 RepID=A0ABT8Z1V4_9SPIR|nr:murein biosynthesis integral membrane protein MurJ [Brachyspira innocens]MDO6994126.1 murein biosynthesis integral membrane protein MurJ [Brachyspira innocens]MDO7021469.1 murein biosynthesis integral membrane protein MurJ [Brachyspira innocens]
MPENKNVSKEKIAKSSLKMSLVTTISRVFGLVRDQIQGALLGTTFIADAFAIGFILPNLLRRLFAEGNMVASFIPVFTELEKEKGKEESKKFFRAVFTLLGLILIGVVAVGIIISPLLVNILYKSGRDNIEALSLASDLSRIMFPYLLFISLAALMQGVLNIRGYYYISAASPILLNTVIISMALFFYFFMPNFFSNMAYVFAFAVLLGGFVQFVYQMPFVHKQGFSFKPYFNFKDPYVIKMIKLFAPGIFGASIYQINLLVSTAFAGAIGEGRVSAVTFATRIHEFVLGVFAVSVATVMLPTLSKLITDNKKDEAVETLSYSLRLVALVTIPATFGFIVLGKEIVRMIFEYGAFSSKSTYLVSSALRYLSVSLFFVASYRILVQSFYAMKDMKTPVYIAFFTFIINAVSNYLCVYVFKFDIIGISISSVIANIVSFCILYVLLMRKLAVKSIINKKIEIVKTAVSSLFMAASVYGVKYYLLSNAADSRIFFIFKVFIVILLGVLSYSIINIVIRNDDFISFINMFVGRLFRKFVRK